MHDWRRTILKEKDTVRAAIEVLNNEALRIVLVVDENNTLTGTVTDGDIRRSLLREGSFEMSLKDIMFKRPRVAKETDSKDAILNQMKAFNLLQIPVVNSKSQIVGLETLNQLLKRNKKQNAVFLMAGGFGTRLRPLTEELPKPLLKVGEKPILETILESFVSQGFERFYISTHYKAELVREYFAEGQRWNVKIDYVHEEKPLGTAGALGLIPEPQESPLIVMNGDLLTKINFSELLLYHQNQSSIATMCVREYEFQVPYGVVKAKDLSVEDIVEKPMHKFFVNAGIYVVEPELVAEVSGYSFLNMPDLLRTQIKNSREISMFPVHEYWLDIGRREEFEKAQEDVKGFVS